MDGSEITEREDYLAFVKRGGIGEYSFLAEQYQADREIVLAAVPSCGYNLCGAAAEYKAEREIVLAAVETDGRALMHAAEECKGDHHIVLAA
eukprot:3185335-Amphidinium_carterae.1